MYIVPQLERKNLAPKRQTLTIEPILKLPAYNFLLNEIIKCLFLHKSLLVGYFITCNRKHPNCYRKASQG